MFGCDPKLFTREKIEEFFTKTCEITKMQKVAVLHWDEGRFDPENTDKVAGISSLIWLRTRSARPGFGESCWRRRWSASCVAVA
jgi:hypothetical protein